MQVARKSIADLDTEISLAKQRLDAFEKLEDRVLKHVDDRIKPIKEGVERIEKKLNNGLSDEVKKNTQFRKLSFWVFGVIGTVLITAIVGLLFKLLVNIDQILKLVEAAK